MTINMEVKKHALQQLQDGSWKLTFIVHGDDMSMELVMAAMGSPYGLAMVPIKYDDTPPNLDHFKPIVKEEYFPDGTDSAKEVGLDGAITQFTVAKREDKSEGEKLRQRACILCKKASFQNFLVMTGYANRGSEQEATKSLYNICKIKSRVELITNLEARELFRKLDAEYKEWGKPSIEEQYKHNLDL